MFVYHFIRLKTCFLMIWRLEHVSMSLLMYPRKMCNNSCFTNKSSIQMARTSKNQISDIWKIKISLDPNQFYCINQINAKFLRYFINTSNLIKRTALIFYVSNLLLLVNDIARACLNKNIFPGLLKHFVKIINISVTNT